MYICKLNNEETKIKNFAELKKFFGKNISSISAVEMQDSATGDDLSEEQKMKLVSSAFGVGEVKTFKAVMVGR